MSYPRPSISDYPEHLNPFYEDDHKPKFDKIGKVRRSSSFGEALRNTLLFKSIRGKKKKQQVNTPSSPPELRRNEARTETQYRQTLPTIVSPSPSPSRVSVSVPLPRSRFSERVAKSSHSDQELHFKEHSALTVNTVKEESSEGSIRHKHRKRRAPLPPGSVNGDFSVSSIHNSSKWSLTSEATDLSAYSDNEQSVNVTDPSVSFNISNIVKEIEKFTENDAKDSEVTDVPDVVSSSMEVTVQCKPCDQSTDENCNVVPETCDKDTVEDTCPDVLFNASCCIEIHEETDDKDDMHKTNDSLTNLINSMELNNNDNKLEDKTDSLTNIINSINMIEHECDEAPVSGVNDDVRDEVLRTSDLRDILDSGDEDKDNKESVTLNEEKSVAKTELGSNVAVT